MEYVFYPDDFINYREFLQRSLSRWEHGKFFERACLLFGYKQTNIISILTDGNSSMKNAHSLTGFSLHKHFIALQ